MPYLTKSVNGCAANASRLLTEHFSIALHLTHLIDHNRNDPARHTMQVITGDHFLIALPGI
jgi:hypothetical protein